MNEITIADYEALQEHGAMNGWLYAAVQPRLAPPVMLTTYEDGEMYAAGWVHESDEGDWYTLGSVPAENLTYPLIMLWYDQQEVAR